MKCIECGRTIGKRSTRCRACSARANAFTREGARKAVAARVGYGAARDAELQTLRARCHTLEDIIGETFWMARRYANRRSTFSPGTVNECIDALARLGIEVPTDIVLREENGDEGRYCKGGTL